MISRSRPAIIHGAIKPQCRAMKPPASEPSGPAPKAIIVAAPPMRPSNSDGTSIWRRAKDTTFHSASAKVLVASSTPNEDRCSAEQPDEDKGDRGDVWHDRQRGTQAKSLDDTGADDGTDDACAE
jgi:hypothetical protein